MTKYLCFGIAKQVVARTEGYWKKYSVEEIKNDFFKTVDKNLYNVTVDKEGKEVYFDLKDEFLAKHAIDLMKEQYEKFIRPTDLDQAIEYYNSINAKDEKERLELINTENGPYLYKFELGWYGLDAYSLFGTSVDAYVTELVSFFVAEKTLMETYGAFLKYTRALLMNSTDSPLKTALVVAL